MTEPSTGTGTPPDRLLDRRWFEEALRSQGFVVEPPPVDVEPRALEPRVPEPRATRTAGPPAEPPIEAPRADGPASDVSLAGERPPVPSALLARIAARGQADPAPADAPGVAAAWTDAVLATVAPWATAVGDETTPMPAAPSPDMEAAPRVPSQAVSQPARLDGGDPRPADQAPDRPDAVVGEQQRQTEPPMDVADPAQADVQAALVSPYVQAAADVAAPTDQAPAPNPVVAAGPDASEGELWALVGGADASATQASGSGPVRVLLTILTALVILVIVVGALVLVSQLA